MHVYSFLIPQYITIWLISILPGYHRILVLGFLYLLSFGIPDKPPCYIRQYGSIVLFINEMSRGIYSTCMYKAFVMQYTTAHLQVLFSSQHLGRITKVSQ